MSKAIEPSWNKQTWVVNVHAIIGKFLTQDSQKVGSLLPVTVFRCLSCRNISTTSKKEKFLQIVSKGFAKVSPNFCEIQVFYRLRQQTLVSGETSSN